MLLFEKKLTFFCLEFLDLFEILGVVEKLGIFPIKIRAFLLGCASYIFVTSGLLSPSCSESEGLESF